MGKDTAINTLLQPAVPNDSSKPKEPDCQETANQPQTKSTLLRVLSEYVASRVIVEQKSAKR